MMGFEPVTQASRANDAIQYTTEDVELVKSLMFYIYILGLSGDFS